MNRSNLKIDELLPLKIVSVKNGHGSFLTFDLIESMKADCGLNECNLHLWVYLCDWTIYKNQIKQLDSNDQLSIHYIDILNQLKNQIIISIKETRRLNEIEIHMQNNVVIILNNNLECYEIDDDMFILYFGKNKYICYSSDNGFYGNTVGKA